MKREGYACDTCHTVNNGRYGDTPKGWYTLYGPSDYEPAKHFCDYKCLKAWVNQEPVEDKTKKPPKGLSSIFRP